MEEDYDNIEDYSDNENFEFDLYEELESEEAQRQGGVKSYDPIPTGSAIYSERKSNYKITVERLLWADGWEDADKDEKDKRAMSLIILKMVFASTDSEGRFRHINATLEFDNKEYEGRTKPEIEAWAPFQHLVRANESEAELKKGSEHSVNAGGNAYGFKLGEQSKFTREISWKQTHFDEGHATAEISKHTGRRNGVNWFVKQNALQNHGVPPELWTAVLISRPTNEPYLVKFRVNVHAGTLQDFTNSIKKWFGLKPGQTKAFLVTPSDKPVVNYEGKDIAENIDINHLGKLRQKNEVARLVVAWGFEDGKDKAEEEKTEKKADGNKAVDPV